MKVQLFLNESDDNFFGFDPTDPTTVLCAAGVDFEVEANSPEDALAAVWQIANSYPEEAFCEARYLPQVAAYRAKENRSLSTGDIAQVGEVFFSCESAGWKVRSTDEIVPFLSELTSKVVYEAKRARRETVRRQAR